VTKWAAGCDKMGGLVGWPKSGCGKISASGALIPSLHAERLPVSEVVGCDKMGGCDVT